MWDVEVTGTIVGKRRTRLVLNLTWDAGGPNEIKWFGIKLSLPNDLNERAAVLDALRRRYFRTRDALLVVPVRERFKRIIMDRLNAATSPPRPTPPRGGPNG